LRIFMRSTQSSQKNNENVQRKIEIMLFIYNETYFY